jgi:glycosyltransferase involved in cell wall biosynthesis
MNKIIYSIIIPHKNTPSLLLRCLKSIPIRNDVEIIIVDDNSSSEFVDLDNFPGVNRSDVNIIFTKANKGAGFARNVGINNATGKWLVFADADDFFLSDFLITLNIYKNSDADIVFFNSTSAFSDSLLPANRHDNINSLINNYLEGKKDSHNKLRYMFYYPISKMIKREMVVNNNILYDEIKVSNDVWFAVMVGYFAKKILVDKKPIYCITVRNNSLSKTKGEAIFDMRVKTNLKVDKFMREINVKNSHHPMMIYILQARKYGIKKILTTTMLSIANGSNIFLGIDKWIINKLKKQTTNLKFEMNAKIISFLAKTVISISPKLYMKLSYLHNRGKFLNLKNPKNVSEIILASMYFGKVNEYSDYVDKIKVRDIYKEWGYEKYLPKIYGIWNTPDEIDFGKLPSAFALKTNHGCGHHYICADKSELNIENAKATLNHALNTKFGLVETQYQSIKPMVYCEEYINDGTGNLPSDYKFLCTDGEIKCILIVTERTEKSYKLLTYNTNWERLDYVTPHYIAKNDFSQPKNLNLMVEISKQISKRFDFVRVDFYDLGSKIFLGELTFTPQGGIMSYFTSEAIKNLGRK